MCDFIVYRIYSLLPLTTRPPAHDRAFPYPAGLGISDSTSCSPSSSSLADSLADNWTGTDAFAPLTRTPSDVPVTASRMVASSMATAWPLCWTSRGRTVVNECRWSRLALRSVAGRMERSTGKLALVHTEALCRRRRWKRVAPRTILHRRGAYGNGAERDSGVPKHRRHPIREHAAGIHPGAR